MFCEQHFKQLQRVRSELARSGKTAARRTAVRKPRQKRQSTEEKFAALVAEAETLD
jgi:hypothetical protein